MNKKYYSKRWRDNSIHISTRGFTCDYCRNKRKGAWRYVDGQRSCEICNREYDPPDCRRCDYKKAKIIKISCPTCKGKGFLTNE